VTSEISRATQHRPSRMHSHKAWSVRGVAARILALVSAAAVVAKSTFCALAPSTENGPAPPSIQSRVKTSKVKRGVPLSPADQTGPDEPSQDCCISVALTVSAQVHVPSRATASQRPLGCYQRNEKLPAKQRLRPANPPEMVAHPIIPGAAHQAWQEQRKWSRTLEMFER